MSKIDTYLLIFANITLFFLAYELPAAHRQRGEKEGIWLGRPGSLYQKQHAKAISV